MLKLPRGQQAARAIGFAVGIALFALMEWGLQLRHNERLAQSRLLATTFASSLRANVDRELNALFTLSASLSSYFEVELTQHGIDDAEVNALLANLYRKSHHVLNFGVAVGYRLTYIYPLQGNEKALGLYYPDLPAQWPAVQRSVASTTGVLAGPVALVQGGQGLIYRVPVFIDGRYWGLLSTVIDASGLYNDVLRDMPQDLELAVRGRDGAGEKGDVFWGDPKLFDDAASVLMKVDVPGGYWQYAVRRSISASQPLTTLFNVLAILIAAVFGFLVYQSQKQRHELALIARMDPLTHVTNRRAFEAVLEGALKRNRKFNQNNFVLLFLDLNRFKFINDTYGHDVGDIVLSSIAQRLRMVLRDDDAIGRWGGDEFVVLLRHSGTEAIGRVIQRIRETLAEPVVLDGVKHQVGVAIGVATYPQDGESVSALVRAADERMYHDKNANS